MTTAVVQLKHTYLRVLHPLLNNTQLRHYPYKRQELRECLESLLAGAQYRDVDPTTRRLVERNLRGTWCQGLRNNAELAMPTTLGVGGASTLSVDAVAVAAEGDDSSAGTAGTTKARRHPRQPSGSLSGGEPDRKSRKHASADDLRHHHHHHHHHPESTLDGSEGVLEDCDALAGAGVCSQSPPTTASFSPHAISRADFAGPSTEHGTALGSALAERYNVVNAAPARPHSATAAEDLSRSVPSIRIPSLTAGGGRRGGVLTSPPTPQDYAPRTVQTQFPLEHPRPRSSSLSAACHASLGFGAASRDSTAPPTPTSPICAPSPAMSTASLSGSVDSAATGGGGDAASPSDSTAGRHGHARRRRRPPPPPIEGGLAALASSGSRPLTPQSRASTASSAQPSPVSTSFLASPATHSASSSSLAAGTTGTGRRRPPPPPPPKPGGGGADKQQQQQHHHHHDAAESDARRLLDGLAVSS